eukprot:NODE_389_length_8228_cov_1.280600.p1 type:complete len:809 gc:universal NODE_389_length_8228_cov_1.280600:1469-3895(+)
MWSLKNVMGCPYTNGEILYTDYIYTAVFNRVLKTDLKRNTQSCLPFESKANIVYLKHHKTYLVTIDAENQMILSQNGEILDRMTMKDDVTALHCFNEYIVVAMHRKIQIWRYDEMNQYWMSFVLEKQHMSSTNVTVLANFEDYLVVGHESGEIRIYSPSTDPEYPLILSRHRGYLVGIHFNGNNMYSVTRDGAVFSWEISLPQVTLKNQYFTNKSQTTTLSSHMHGDMLVMGYHTGIFDLYEMPKFSHISTLSLKQRLDSVKFDLSGDFIAMGSKYGHLIVWEWKAEAFLYKQSGHFLNCKVVAVNDQYIASGDEFGTIKLFNASTGNSVITFTEHQAEITQLQFTKKDVLISASVDGTIKAFDVKRYKHFRTMSAPNPVSFTCLAISDDVICAGTRDTYEIYVWFLTTGELLQTLTGHEAPISSLKFINNTLVSGSWDKTIRLWSIFDSSQNVEVIQHSSDILSIAVSPLDNEYAVSCLDGTISFWDLEGKNTSIVHVRQYLKRGRKQNQVMTAQQDTHCSTITYSADGSLILGGGDSKYICVFNKDMLVQRIEISRNTSMDGMKSVLNSKHMTSSGISKKLLNEKLLFQNADEQNEKLNYAKQLPGVKQSHDPGVRSVRPDVQVSCIEASADGTFSVAATTEGVFLYTTQLVKLPAELEYNLTESSCLAALKHKQFLQALLGSLKLNSFSLFQQIIETMPEEVYEMVCSDFNPLYYSNLIQMLSEWLEITPHFELGVKFVSTLTRHILSKEEDFNISAIKNECKGLKRIIQSRYNDVKQIADKNKYLLMFALKKANLQKEDSVEIK